MAQKTSGEFEKEFMDGLKASTGKDLSAWMKALDSAPSKKRNEVIAWLKAEHGFGHMNASLLAGIHANGGKPVYQSTDDLLDTQFAKAADMRPLYEALVDFVKSNFPSATILPKKTYISIVDNREFGAVNIKPKELRLGMDLGDRPFDEQAEKAKLTGPMPRISHMRVVTDRSQLNSELTELLKDSHGRCHKEK
jgi:predicted transport protein